MKGSTLLPAAAIGLLGILAAACSDTGLSDGLDVYNRTAASVEITYHVPLSSGVDSVAATNQLGAGSYSKLYFPSYDGTGCGNGTLIARSGGIELGRLDRPCPGRTWEIKTPSPS